MSGGRCVTGTVVGVAHDTIIRIECIVSKFYPKLQKYRKMKHFVRAKLMTEMQISIGDVVRVQEHRPISRRVCWVVVGKK